MGKLYSVCIGCNVVINYDGARQWGDFDKCSKCGDVMDLWTEAGVKNENGRRFYSRTEPLPLPYASSPLTIGYSLWK